MRRLLAVAVIAVSVFSSGCSQDSGKPSSKPLNWDEALERVAPTSIKDEVDGLKSKVVELETRVGVLEISKDEFKTTWFDTTGGKGYGRVDANIGYFLVTLDRVEPYLDGQKVTLLIGNPNSVTFSGFDIKASWMARQPDLKKLPTEERTKAWFAYTASHREKEIKLTDTLRPGTWNKVQFTVAPAKAEEFGKLGIAITTNEVFLAGGR